MITIWQIYRAIAKIYINVTHEPFDTGKEGIK